MLPAGEVLEGKDLSFGPVYSPEDCVPEAKANRAVNSARGIAPMPLKPIARDAECAVVGYGPSLTATWRGLTEFAFIWTTSKAHDFLLRRDIQPDYHVDVDYRQHKASFVTPDAGVQYVLASHVHPDYTAKLAKHELWLFHSQIPEGGPYEPGYPLIRAEMDAGLQAAKLAYMLGYRKQHWFGLDASVAHDGTTHAGPHEGVLGQADPHEVRVSGRVYKSNGLLVRQAVEAENMLRRYPRMEVTIHGDGMLRPFLQERGRVRVC